MDWNERIAITVVFCWIAHLSTLLHLFWPFKYILYISLLNIPGYLISRENWENLLKCTNWYQQWWLSLHTFGIPAEQIQIQIEHAYSADLQRTHCAVDIASSVSGAGGGGRRSRRMLERDWREECRAINWSSCFSCSHTDWRTLTHTQTHTHCSVGKKIMCSWKLRGWTNCPCYCVCLWVRVWIFILLLVLKLCVCLLSRWCTIATKTYSLLLSPYSEL